MAWINYNFKAFKEKEGGGGDRVTRRKKAILRKKSGHPQFSETKRGESTPTRGDIKEDWRKENVEPAEEERSRVGPTKKNQRGSILQNIS